MNIPHSDSLVIFAGQDGVEAAWAVLQPILGLATTVHDYEPGTWGPPEAEKLTAGICGCDSPVWLLPDGKDGVHGTYKMTGDPL